MPIRMPNPIANSRRGFTLIEAVIVIVITGILAAMVAVFIKKPIDAYFDTANRAELTDVADTALRRMARDINGALPNSVRTSGNFLEFVPIKAAGRYRADFDSTSAGCTVSPYCGDILNFDSPTDGTFDILGPAVDVASGDSIVVYNLGPGSDVYEGTNRRAVPAGSIGVGRTSIGYTVGGTQFLRISVGSGSRFHVVSTTVSYECAADLANPANGKLLRHSGTAIAVTQPVSGFPADDPLLATNVAVCSMTYSPGRLQSMGLVSILLTLTRNGESVTLQHQVSVNNTP
jgi:MSHA biogenesis protein MshO